MRHTRSDGRRRRLLRVREIPFVGGELSVDFVNTTGARGTGRERERLETYEDLLVWSRRAGVLTSKQAKHLAGIASREPDGARRALSCARRFRESLYRVLRGVVEARRPEAAEVALLDRLFRRERARYELLRVGSGYELRRHDPASELDRMIWPIVASASRLLTSPAIAKLKRCGECDWLFVDDSKNGSRLWCKNECGDRVRARRHYARRKGRSRPRTA